MDYTVACVREIDVEILAQQEIPSVGMSAIGTPAFSPEAPLSGGRTIAAERACV